MLGMEINGDRFFNEEIPAMLKSWGRVKVRDNGEGLRTFTIGEIKALGFSDNRFIGPSQVKWFDVLKNDSVSLVCQLFKLTRYITHLSFVPIHCRMQEVVVGRRLQEELGCDYKQLESILSKALSAGLIFRTSVYGGRFVPNMPVCGGLGYVARSLGICGDFHYIYQMTHDPSGYTYIGQHVCDCCPCMDNYFGSGVAWKKIYKSDPDNCSKAILDVSFSQEITDRLEREHIALCRVIHGDLCVNIRDGGKFKMK